MNDPNHERFDVGEVSLHAVVEGSGPPVLLLHGFPEFWYSWRAQLPALAAAGFRAVAPDLRGYNESDRPEGIGHYTVDKLVADAAGLARAVAPGGKVHVVGHDWGGGIAWALAHHHPELVDKLVILNAPHPLLTKRKLFTSPTTALGLWHFFFFQLPFVPEQAMLNNGFLKAALRGLATRKDAFSDDDLAQYAAALRKPGAATAMLNYYRALRYQLDLKLPGRISAPTMVIWGDKDKALPAHLLDGLPRYVQGPLRIEHIADASHWVQHDAAERVNELLIRFLRDNPGSTPRA
jgi:pimeloyl-ACP methyl ester carboxylesterase